jgi:hypothetical protein
MESSPSAIVRGARARTTARWLSSIDSGRHTQMRGAIEVHRLGRAADRAFSVVP